MNRSKRVVTLFPALVIVGCGTLATQGPQERPLQSARIAAQAKPDGAIPALPASPKTPSKVVKADPISSDAVSLETAYARLTATPGYVYPGGRSLLFLDVWSTSKPIRSYEARWLATDGFLDRWYTYDSGWNGWRAPFSSFPHFAHIQARVKVKFQDSSTAAGTVAVNVWINQ